MSDDAKALAAAIVLIVVVVAGLYFAATGPVMSQVYVDGHPRLYNGPPPSPGCHVDPETVEVVCP